MKTIFTKMPERQALFQDGVLMLNAAHAKIPGAVRLALHGVPMAYFHVRSSEEGSTLGFSTPDKEFTALASFADRHEADQLLADVRAELFWLRPNFAIFIKKTLAVLLAVMLVLFALALVMAAINQYRDSLPPPPPSPISLDDVPAKPGEPVDADVKLAPPRD